MAGNYRFRFAHFCASLALSQKQVFSAVLPLFPRCARGSTKRKRSLLQIVALRGRGARACPCGPAPALSAPAGGRRGVLLGLRVSHPCSLGGRAALRAALLRRRRNRRGRCRAGWPLPGGRAVCPARLVALPSAPPASVLSASPPRGFCPSMGYGAAMVVARVGVRVPVSRLRLLRALQRWPCAGGLVSRGAPPSSSRGVGSSRAGQVGGGALSVSLLCHQTACVGSGGGAAG